MKIGLDVMGGDFAPESTLEGAILANSLLSQGEELILIGDKDFIIKGLQQLGKNPEEFKIVHADQVISMNDHPTKALTQKPNSSISIGFHLLKEQKIDAFAGVGNTGAMMVGAFYSVRAVTGVIRPCVTSILPKENGGVGVLLDVGANADCKPDVLYQFGILGSLFAEHVYGIKSPKVGLLNIGEEEEKGSLLAQATHSLMKDNSDFNFIGNVEGRDLFTDKADVIVCDGFTGNVVLKTAEGFYDILNSKGIKDDYFSRFNYESYGGTPILGINSNVIIGHGISNAQAIKNMILLCKDVVEANLSEKIKQAFI
jgi:phosphate acyltransferase